MKEVIERCNWLVNKCEDKAITPDVKDDVSYLLEEIERLNNIINELEKWVKEDKECFETQFYMGRCVNFQCILDKIQELKGDSSNE